MKKVLSLILVFTLIFLMSSCGVSKEQVEKDLQGAWEHSWYASAVGFYCSIIYDFNDGDMTKMSIRNGKTSTETGFYIIKDDVIEVYVHGEEDPEAELTYDYDGDKLTLVDYGDGTVESVYEKV